MSIKVSNQAKKEFLTYLLKAYTFKNIEDIRILNLLIDSDALLNITSIVNTNEHAKRYLEISTTCSENNFLFTKGNVSTTNSMKAYHDLRIDQRTPLDLNICYDKKHLDPNYYLVKEDRENEYPESLRVLDKVRAKALINYQLRMSKKAMYEKSINRALDTGDYISFKKITEEMRRDENEMGEK